MADKPTSTNQGLNLATVNTTHAGMTSAPTDVCKVPPKMDPMPFMNTAPVDRNPVGMTSARTVVDSKQVITIRARFGDPSDDAHPGSGGGVASGTYRSYAWVQQGSPDLRTEGAPTGRHTDDTLQNNGNTSGMLRDRNQALDAINAAKGKLKRCTIVQVDFQEDDSPRKVTTAERGLYLEICEGSTITITAHRRNMAAATAAQTGLKAPVAACTKPPSGWLATRFQVSRSGKLHKLMGRATPSPLVKSETQDGKDVFKLTDAWVGEKKATKGVSPEPAPGKDADRRAATAARSTGTMADRSGRVGNVVAPPANPGRRAAIGLPAAPLVGGRPGDVLATRAEFMAAKAGAQSAAAERTKATIAAREAAFNKGARSDKQIVTGLKMFLDLWKTLVPTTITIASAGCTGAFVGQVKIYPEGAFEYDPIELFQTFCQPFEAFMGRLKNVLEGLSPATGREWDIGILNKSLLGSNRGSAQRPTLKIQWEYKELTEDSKEAGGPKMNQVGLAFGLLFGIEKLVFARADFSVSLFVIAGGPGIGGVAKKILEWAGIEVELGIALELSVGVAGFIGRDEYHVMQGCDVDTTLAILISIYLVARAGSFGYAKVDVTFAFGLKLKEVRYGAGKRPPLEVLVADQRFTISFQATIQANVRGLRDPRKIPDEPHNLITPVTWPDKWRTIF